MFRPDLVGEEVEGIHEILANSIIKSDMDLRKALFSNIVLSGGSTLFKGFGDRLLNELKRLAPKDVKIKIASPKERLYSTWIGQASLFVLALLFSSINNRNFNFASGSILASLDTFKKMWISKREYETDGVKIIHKKTF